MTDDTKINLLTIIVGFLLMTPTGWAFQIFLGFIIWSIVKPKPQQRNKR